jgi:hypothetical protein
MKRLGWIYRILYLYILFIFGIRVFPTELSWRGVLVLSYPISFVLLFWTVLRTLIRPRYYSGRFLWGVTLAWCLMFTWLAWFARSTSPFIMHEAHTFDAGEYVREVRHWYTISISIYTFLVAWFLSFPLVQRFAVVAHISRDGTPDEINKLPEYQPPQ